MRTYFVYNSFESVLSKKYVLVTMKPTVATINRVCAYPCLYQRDALSEYASPLGRPQVASDREAVMRGE